MKDPPMISQYLPMILSNLPAYFADLMKLTTETLTRRISRIKTEKLMLVNSKESLEDIVKSLGDLSFCARN